MKNISEQTKEDNRKFFRINDMVFLSYRVVSWAEVRSSQRPDSSLPVHKLTLKSNLDQLSRELVPLNNIIKKSNTKVAEYLSALDKKINLLSEYLLEEEDTETDVEPQEVNIGGGGLMFVSDNPIVVGAMLELKMKLLPEVTSIYSYAKVVSSTGFTDDSKGQKYKIGVEFENMEDGVRDLITRHVLIKEQTLLNKS